MSSPIKPIGMSEDGQRPLYEGGVRAWRIWHMYDSKLFAIIQGKVWKKGVNEAEDFHSSGGFYGFKNIAEAERQENDSWEKFQTGAQIGETGRLAPWATDGDRILHSAPSPKVVIGSYIGYGRVKIGTRGMRAQFAIPEYILTPADFNYAVELVGVAENYGMTIVTREQADELKAGLIPFERP
jgi:hypothetical protein